MMSSENPGGMRVGNGDVLATFPAGRNGPEGHDSACRGVGVTYTWHPRCCKVVGEPPIKVGTMSSYALGDDKHM